MDEKEKKEETILKPAPYTIIIPECCREGWESCKHSAQKIRISKRNVGL